MIQKRTYWGTRSIPSVGTDWISRGVSVLSVLIGALVCVCSSLSPSGPRHPYCQLWRMIDNCQSSRPPFLSLASESVLPKIVPLSDLASNQWLAVGNADLKSK